MWTEQWWTRVLALSWCLLMLGLWVAIVITQGWGWTIGVLGTMVLMLLDDDFLGDVW